MSAKDERSKAFKLAASSSVKALQAAGRVSDPWYRCQSLAAVARFASEDQVVRIAEEAFTVAHLGRDVYQRVAASAWPIRALAERGKERQVQHKLSLLLAEVTEDTHPVSRIASLVLLWHASCPLAAAIKQPVLDALLSACRAANSWKAGRVMRDVALVVASEDRAQAQRIINAMRESIYRRQAQRRLDAGQTAGVRAFF